jgi:hypothetical protein
MQAKKEQIVLHTATSTSEARLGIQGTMLPCRSFLFRDNSLIASNQAVATRAYPCTFPTVTALFVNKGSRHFPVDSLFSPSFVTSRKLGRLGRLLSGCQVYGSAPDFPVEIDPSVTPNGTISAKRTSPPLPKTKPPTERDWIDWPCQHVPCTCVACDWKYNARKSSEWGRQIRRPEDREASGGRVPTQM